MAVSDEALVERGQQGDTTAVNELLTRHYDRLYAVCRRLAGNDADALDATQEALMSIVRGLDRFDGRAAFTTWSYRVATNACLDELRRRRRRPEPSEDAIVDHAVAFAADDQHALRSEIDQALQQIPEQYRAPVVLRDMCDLDYAEIAEVLDIAPGTVRSRIARGRSALADLLSGNQTSHSRRHTTSDD